MIIHRKYNNLLHRLIKYCRKPTNDFVYYSRNDKGVIKCHYLSQYNSFIKLGPISTLEMLKRVFIKHKEIGGTITLYNL